MRAVGEGDGVRRAAAACGKTRESLIEGAVDVYLDLQFSRQGAAVVVTRGDITLLYIKLLHKNLITNQPIAENRP